MIQLILYGLLAAGLAFGGMKVWNGFTGQYVEEGRQEQLKADEGKVKQANEIIAAEKKRADTAEADNALAKQAADRQNEAIAAANKLAGEAQAAARAAGIKYAAEVAKNAKRQADLRAAAGAIPKQGQTCEQILSATDAILRESARERQGINDVR